MLDSTHHIQAPLRLFSGEDALAVLVKELSRSAVQRPLVLCGHTLANNGVLETVLGALSSFNVAAFTGVKSHSPTGTIEEAALAARDHRADGLIAMGGGSAMVSARAVAIVLGETQPLTGLCTQRDDTGRMISPRLDAPKLPIFAVPTTPSTAMTKAGSAVLDDHSGRRLALFDPKTRAQAILVVPSFLDTAPTSLVRSATLNTLCSALEALSIEEQDHLALSQLIYAVGLCSDPCSSREDLVQAAILSGRGTDHAGMGLATSLSHAIAICSGIDPSVAKAAALPHTIRYNWDHIPKGRANLAHAMKCDEHALIPQLLALFQSYGSPPKLRDLGIKESDVPKIADHAMGDWFTKTNPRAITDHATLCSVIKSAW